MNAYRSQIFDAVVGRGLVAVEAASLPLRRALVRLVTGRRPSLAEVRRVVAKYVPDVAAAIQDGQVASWIAGAVKVARSLPEEALHAAADQDDRSSFLKSDAKFEIVRMPAIDRAVDWLAETRIVTAKELKALSAQAKLDAFTVAGEWGEDAVESVRDHLIESIQSGTTLRDFTRRVANDVDDSFLGPAHAETVFRTVVQRSYSEGYERIASDPIVEEIFPYQEYIATHDSRTRRTHRRLEVLGLSGTGIYRRDDPMWIFFDPPWDYNCRCGKIPLTIAAAAARGVAEAKKWLRTGTPPEEPTWRVSKIPFRPENDFITARARAA